MTQTTPPQRPSRGFRLFALLAVILAATAAAASDGQAPLPAAAPDPAVPVGDAATVEPLDVWEPPDGQWLKDETGQEYYILEVPRLEGHYRFVDDHHVRLRGGLTLTLVRYDETTFYAKIIRVRPEDNPPPRRRAPSAAELAEAEKRYVVAVPEVERVAWTSFDRGLPRTGQWRNGFDLADVNRDGKLDIVHGPARKGDFEPKVFLGDGAGNWTPWPLRIEARELDYGDVAARDFDGDGHVDLALAMHLIGVTVLLGDGQGGFRESAEGLDYGAPSEGGQGAAFSSRALAAVDWNSDRRPDLLALGEGMRLDIAGGSLGVGNSSSFGPVVYVNGGAGKAWRRHDEGTDGSQPAGEGLAVGDFDLDGRLDFAVTNSGVNTRRLLMLGERNGGWRALELPVRPNGFAEFLAAGDFDADGKTDLAIAWTNFELKVRRSGVDVLLNRTPPAKRGTVVDPVWEVVPVAVASGSGRYQTVAAGDLDGDGHQDLATSSSTGAIDLFLGDGRGGFAHQAGPRPEAGSACAGYDLRLVDLDGDRRAELVGNFAGEEPNAMQTAFLKPVEICRTGGSIRAWSFGPSRAASGGA